MVRIAMSTREKPGYQSTQNGDKIGSDSRALIHNVLYSLKMTIFRMIRYVLKYLGTWLIFIHIYIYKYGIPCKMKHWPHDHIKFFFNFCLYYIFITVTKCITKRTQYSDTSVVS